MVLLETGVAGAAAGFVISHLSARLAGARPYGVPRDPPEPELQALPTDERRYAVRDERYADCEREEVSGADRG